MNYIYYSSPSDSIQLPSEWFIDDSSHYYIDSILYGVKNMSLIYYPDNALASKCDKIVVFDDTVGNLFDDLTYTMNKHKGVGLSANQIGRFEQAMIIKSAKGEIYEMANPIIIETEGSVSLKEGCLSAPSIYFDITRPASVLVQYQDRHGEVKKAMAEGIEARAILHECEHLQGEFFFKHVNRQQRKIAISKLRKIPKR